MLNLTSCGIASKTSKIDVPKKEWAHPLAQGEAAPWSGWLVDDEMFKLLYREATADKLK